MVAWILCSMQLILRRCVFTCTFCDGLKMATNRIAAIEDRKRGQRRSKSATLYLCPQPLRAVLGDVFSARFVSFRFVRRAQTRENSTYKNLPLDLTLRIRFLFSNRTESKTLCVVTCVADCWYEGERFEEGVQVVTNEPCLNCTCSRGALLCYLRVCPRLPNPPPPGCILLHRYKACCPELICSGKIYSRINTSCH